MKSCNLISSVIFSVLLLVALECPASIVTYEGYDAGAGPGDARPVSAAAQASFFAALTAAGVTAHTLDFESIPVQYSNNINLTTMTLYQVGTSNQWEAGVSQGGTESSIELYKVRGYNTTASGNNFLRIVPEWDIGTAGARLVFNSPVEFFGAYYTGLGTAAGSLSVKFNAGGIDYSYPVTGGSLGGVNYFGFTSFGESFTEVSMVLTGVIGTRDIFSIDDITTGLKGTYIAPVPIPAAVWLLGSGLVALLGFRRKFSK